MNSSKRVSQKKSKNKKSFKKIFKRRLTRQFQRCFGWLRPVAQFVTGITCGLMICNAVWLKRVCQASDGSIKIESRIRKLERFLKNQYVDYQLLSLMIYRMLNMIGKVTLLIDRTNWDFGKQHINILVITILFVTPDNKRFAIPIAWEVFSKKGNSNSRERAALLQKVINVVGKDNIECIMGDREFIGEEWIQFLNKNGVPFIIRIKANLHVTVGTRRVGAAVLVASVKKHEKITFDIVLNDIPMRLAATRTKDDELVIVVASHDIEGDLLNEYRLRWIIELFFKSIKSNGFHIEETHMTDPSKIKKLFALIAIATLYAVQAGVIRHVHVKKIPIKNHGRPTYSLFTYGLDFLRALFAEDIPDMPSIYNLFTPSPQAYNSHPLNPEHRYAKKHNFVLLEG